METTINPTVLRQIAAHNRSLGVSQLLKGLAYERCAELSWVIDYLSPRFEETLRFLDIGTGKSPFPTFLYRHSRWEITCLDKYQWVNKQTEFSKKIDGGDIATRRFRVIEGDLLEGGLPDESFDLITCISVIEHFAGNTDSQAMRAAARLLRPGGQMILTTLVNEPFYAEFYLDQPVYGVKSNGSLVFYQRHYDVESIEKRLIGPSGLTEKQRVYFGDYGFQCFEKVMQQPKPLRALYAWNTPRLAQQFLSYRSTPVSRKDMRMNTASGLIAVLEKSPSKPSQP